MSDSAKGRVVFMSYASEDAEAAHLLSESLRAGGIQVWLDQSELRGGDAWDATIRAQIRGCALFIPIISNYSQHRLEGYFRREWKIAVDRTQDMAAHKAFILPIVLDEVDERTASVPEIFREVQWTRLKRGAVSPQFTERVSNLVSCEEVSVAAGGKEAEFRSSSAPPAPTVPSPKPRWTWQRLSVVLASAAVLLIAGYLISEHRRLSGGVVEQAAAPSTADRSVAVLPFVDLSERKDQEYFASGVAEDLINRLATIPHIVVIGHTSSFQFKGERADLKAISSALKVRYVVEGSVQRSDANIRITAQLVDALDGRTRWAATYDRSAGDVLKLQDEITLNIARALQLEVVQSADPTQTLTRPVYEAYDSYLKGLHAMDRYDQQGLTDAATSFGRSLALDPTYPAPAEGLALALDMAGELGFLPPNIGFEHARRAAYTALKLNPKSGVAHAVLSSIHVCYDWDWTAAREESILGMTLAPNNPITVSRAGRELFAIGDTVGAISLLNTSIALDPLDPVLHVASAWGHLHATHFAAAEQELRHALELSPTYTSAHYYLGTVLLSEGRLPAALEEMRKETPEGGQLIGLAMVYYAMHRAKESDEILAQLIKTSANDNAYQIAGIYAFRGEKDKAFEWLNRAYQQKESSLYLIHVDFMFPKLYDDVRYKGFLRKMRFPEQIGPATF